MKKTLLCLSLVILLMSGCQELSHNSTIGNENKPTLSESADQKYLNEINDLKEKVETHSKIFSTTSPLKYQLEATIDFVTDKENVDRISYEIFITKPKYDMTDITMSFYLNPEMFNILNTSSLFQSNIINDMPVSVTKDGEHNGLSLGRAFLLQEETNIEKTMTNVLQDIYVKISYTSNGERATEYFHLKCTPTQRLKSFLSKL